MLGSRGSVERAVVAERYEGASGEGRDDYAMYADEAFDLRDTELWPR